MRTKNQVGKRFTRDLELVGIPHRRLHDARRTFISLAQADGAQREHLLPVTHSSGSTRAAFDLYTTIPWSTRSKAVALFRPVPASNYKELASRILAKEGCYASYYVAKQVPENTGEKVVEAPGVESGLGERVSAGFGGGEEGSRPDAAGTRVGPTGLGSGERRDGATLARIALERLERGALEAVAAILRTLSRRDEPQGHQ